jgi:hypothetical protein
MAKKKSSKSSTECISANKKKSSKSSTECISANKKKSSKSSTECISANKEAPKRKRGRPKKINTECSQDVSTECADVPKKRRGRPPKKKVFTESPEIDLSNVKTLKVLGYCSSTECTCTITDADYEEGKKTIVNCIRCGTRQRVSQLRESLSKEARNVSKKAFLNNVTQVYNEQDHEAYHHEVEIPEAFKAFTPDVSDWDS